MEVINKRRKSKDEDWNVGDVEVYDSPSIEDLLKEINVYSHVEKVNAHLVVED